jgi:hypothetical protein
MSENDLVLLCKENPLTSATTPTTHTLASVEGNEGKQALRLRLHFGAPSARWGQSGDCEMGKGA